MIKKASKIKKAGKAKKSAKTTASDCIILEAIPVESLSRFVFNREPRNADQIAAYVEGQSPGEKIKHAERVMTEYILGQKYDCWDVRTNKTRLWVITPTTNLYDQKLFPSLDYTFSFHLGIVARFMAQREPSTGVLEQMTLPAAWRKWEQAGEALNSAQEPEAFQSVGMLCRECLIAMVRALALPEMVPENTEPPQADNAVDWCDLIAERVAHGSSASRVRGYLKAISTSGWRMVNWLTHEKDATRADGVFAHQLTEHILVMFGTAMLRYRQRIPDRCEGCGSYQFELWSDQPGVPLKPRCCNCGWMKSDEEPLY